MMKYLLGFVAGVVLSSVSVGAGDDYWQRQQQLNALQQMQLFQQLQYNDRHRQLLQEQVDRSQGRTPC